MRALKDRKEKRNKIHFEDNNYDITTQDGISFNVIKKEKQSTQVKSSAVATAEQIFSQDVCSYCKNGPFMSCKDESCKSVMSGKIAFNGKKLLLT